MSEISKKSLQLHPLTGRNKNSVNVSTIEYLHGQGGETSAAVPGSITAEASLALTIFILFAASLLSLFGVMQIQTEVCSASAAACRELARDAYILTMRDSPSDEEIRLMGGAAGYGLSAIAADVIVRSQLDEGTLSRIQGLNFLDSRLLAGDQDIVINAAYSVPLGFLAAGQRIDIDQKYCCRAWTGRELQHPDTEDEPVYVFVAENGVVYHVSENCTHLRLSVRVVSMEDVGAERNMNGAKYYACERCGGTCGEAVMIAKEGNRYHSDRDCPGLKRTYSRVRLDEIDLPACSRCAGG